MNFVFKWKNNIDYQLQKPKHNIAIDKINGYEALMDYLNNYIDIDTLCH